MKYVLLFLSLLISSCSSLKYSKAISVLSADNSGTRHLMWTKLLGSWEGTQRTEEGGYYNWTVTRFIDGKFIMEGHVTKLDGSTSTQVEVGFWGVSGDVKFTIFKGWLDDRGCRPSSQTNPLNYDAYKILSISQDKMEYQDLSDGDVFIAQKKDLVDGDRNRITSKASGCFAQLL